MPGTATRGRVRGRLAAAVLGVALLGAAGAAFGEDGGRSGRGGHHGGGGGSRTPNWSDPKWYPQQQDNRRLISPMGSAANVPSGYYQQNMGWNGPPLEYGPLVIPSVPYVTFGQPLYTPPPEPTKVVVVNQVTVNTPPPVVVEQPRYERPRYEEPQRPAEPAAPPAPKPTAPQKVVFDISPGDALVKLDGRKLGTAADLGAPGEPLQLSPGVYILQVDHPSYKTQRLVFGVSAERVRVEVDLAADDPAGRARVH